MSREAVKKVVFLGKAPRDQRDLHWILHIADRLSARRVEVPEVLPSNVVRFPRRDRAGRRIFWE